MIADYVWLFLINTLGLMVGFSVGFTAFLVLGMYTRPYFARRRRN